MLITVSITLDPEEKKVFNYRSVELSASCYRDNMNITLGELIADAIDSIIDQDVDKTEVMEAMQKEHVE